MDAELTYRREAVRAAAAGRRGGRPRRRRTDLRRRATATVAATSASRLVLVNSEPMTSGRRWALPGSGA